MQVPLRHQVSEYDCVPTTFLNAVAYLFPRRAIPPLVVRHIYAYSLDTVSRDGRIGRGGTSRHAVRLLGHWLASYKTRRFSVQTQYLEGKQVHLRRRSPIIECLKDHKGVAMCHLHLGHGEWHYVLAVELKQGWVHTFDPYWRLSIRGLDGQVRLLERHWDHSPNLAIRRDWLDHLSNKRRYCLGRVRKRECLLMWRDR